MNRRKVVSGGLGLLTLGAFGPSWGARLCDPTFDGEPVSSCGTPLPGGGPRALESLASEMSPNTWQRLGSSDAAGSATATLKSMSVTPSSSPRSAFEYSQHFFWNSEAKELHFRGGGATSGGGNLQRHFRYRDATGEWDAVTPWMTGQTWIHQWGHFCGNPRTGDLYFRRTGGDDIHKWTYQPFPWVSNDPTGSDSWPYFGSVGIVDPQTTAALGFFPDYNNGDGALVFVETYGGDCSVHVSDARLTTWSKIGSDVFSGGGYEQIITHCPGQQWMLFGGGKTSGGSTRRLAKVGADGTVTRLNDVPFEFGANSTGKIAAHPNGRIFGIDIERRRLYEYNESADSWSTGSLSGLPFEAHWNAVCMIPEHNVIYVLAQLGGAARSTIEEWLYKI